MNGPDFHILDKEIASLKAKLEAQREGDLKALDLALNTVKEASSNSLSLFALIASVISMLIGAYAILRH